MSNPAPARAKRDSNGARAPVETFLGRGILRAVRLDLAAAFLGIVTYLAYAVVGRISSNSPDRAAHFVLLARAYLQGHLWLDPTLAATLPDISPDAGRYYLSFPPMPAILMLPFVAILGPSFDERVFSIVLGATNVALGYLLIRRLSQAGFAGPGLRIDIRSAVATALLLGVGTVEFYAALAGSVWFVAHVVAVFFLLLYLIETFGRGRPVLVGLALAAAFLARTPTIFAAVFWLTFEFARPAPFGERLARLTRFALPVVLAVAFLLVQNELRFGSPLDFGYLKMHVSPNLAPDLRQYGQFSTHFLGRNLAAFLITPLSVGPGVRTWLQAIVGPVGPRAFVDPIPGLPPFPIQFDPWGNGLWCVSPAFLFGLRSIPLPSAWVPLRRRAFSGSGSPISIVREPDAWLARLWLAAIVSTTLIAAPDLLYYNTGWYQFGYRFALDFIPFLLLLTAAGLRRPIPRLAEFGFDVLLVYSVGVNLLGARWFLHLPPYS